MGSVGVVSKGYGVGWASNLGNRWRSTAEMTPIMRNVLSVSSAPLLPDGYVDYAEIAYLIASSEHPGEVAELLEDP
jgi:hypothetical protein